MAHRYNLPIIPIAFSYRRATFPFSLLNFMRSLMGKKKLPMITLRIGEPLLVDKDLRKKEAIEKLQNDCHSAIVHLSFSPPVCNKGVVD